MPIKKRTPQAPGSYLDCRRPPLLNAIAAERDVPVLEAIASQRKKGYFTPRPRPWKLGFRDRGHGHGDFAVLDRFGDLVAKTPYHEDAELIIEAVNASKS
jgi:hypothetical protein